jgi:error-prone DNA polymerase
MRKSAIGSRLPAVGENLDDDMIALRLGLRYVRGLHEEAGRAIVRERGHRTFSTINDLAQRVPELRKNELNTLGEIGALNAVGISPRRHGDELFHRRDALWSAGAAANATGPLLKGLNEPDMKSPLKMMSDEERLVADFRGTGMTVGPHPMAYHRARLQKMGVRPAIELGKIPSGRIVRTAGGVIARQRPGTAKGFVFLSLEDETGVSNAIVTPDLFQRNRLALSSEQFLVIEGILQNQDGVISVKAARVEPLRITRAQSISHDFH